MYSDKFLTWLEKQNKGLYTLHIQGVKLRPSQEATMQGYEDKYAALVTVSRRKNKKSKK